LSLRAGIVTGIISVILCCGLTRSLRSQSLQRKPRINQNVDETAVVRLPHSTHGAIRREARDVGRASADLPMERVLLALKSSPEQEAALERLLQEQHDPSSPNYHRWLTPEEFGERFGAAAEEVEIVSRWLRSHGFTVNAVSKNRREIEFGGAVRDIEKAFRTEIHQYDLRGRKHTANAMDISIPAALAPVVDGVVALNDFPLRQPPPIQPAFNRTDGSHGIGPYDFATIYNVLPLWNTQGIDGSGQNIAIVAQSNINLNDIISFRNQFGLSVNNPDIVVNGIDPGIKSGDQDEAQLDVEWAGAVAKGAKVKLVVSGSTNSTSGVFLSASYIVNNNVAPIASMSYGFCEAASLNSAQFFGNLWQQAAAQGISVFVASGDSGSADCESSRSGGTATTGFGVDAVASSPYNVAVGGTTFDEGGNDSTYWNASNGANLSSAKSYIPEVVWNDAGSGLASGGGGVSTIWSTPSWQKGLGVPTGDPGAPNSHHRYVPDVSLAASSEHDGYALRLRGSLFSAGGTSVGAPAFAGIMALINQATGGPNGNPNPRLYAIAAQAPSVFHDVTSGTNAVACTIGSSPDCSASGVMNGYSAAPGFDLATGWGSVDVTALVSAWTSTPLPVQISSTSLSNGAVGASYAQGLNASGGTPPYTWTVIGGNLPPGVTLSPAGFFSGAPTASGTYNVTLQVTDSRGSTATISLTLTVADTASGTVGTFHVFPQFADGQLSGGVFYRTTLMITNPSDAAAANCSLQLWSGGHSVTVPGFAPSYSLPAGGWVIASTTGAQSFQSGYATLQCSAKVEAQLLYSLYSGGVKVSEATVFSSPPAASVRILGDETEKARLALGIANDSDQTVAYTITVTAGNSSSSGSVTLNPRSSTAKFLDELLTSDILAGRSGQVTISSSTGTASVIGLRFTDQIFTTILGNPASPPGAAANTYHVFPQFADGLFADGSGYKTTRMYVNPNTSAIASCSTQLRGLTTDGNNAFSANLSPGAFVISRTNGGQAFQKGYATLQCSAKVDAQAVYSYYGPGGAKLGEATVFSSPASARVQILADSREGAQVGLAIANDSDQANTYTIAVYDANENLVGSADRTINARTSVAAFVREFVPSVPANTYGRVVVTSTTGLANIIGLRFTGNAFTTIPETIR
jgi:pseudomonalisin